MNESESNTIESIFTFWFEETTQEQKYNKDDAFDEKIKDNFRTTYWKVVNGETESWRETPEGRLAEIIVLDQFARNMFRDDKQFFANDELALTLAREALAVGADMELTNEQRHFFYMPFMHSESREVHEEALKIFTEKSSEGGT